MRISVDRFKMVKAADPVADVAKNADAFRALVSELPADDHRFVVFDFTDTKADGRQIAKLVLIKWCVRACRVKVSGSPHHHHHYRTTPSQIICRCPDSVHFRIKPVIGATYQRLKDKLQGLGKDIQAVDTSDLDYAKIRGEL